MVSLSSPLLSLSLPPHSPSPTRRRASTLGFPQSRPPRPQIPKLTLLRRAPRLRILDLAPFPGGSRDRLSGNGAETRSQSFVTCCHSADFSWIQVGDNYQAMVIQCLADQSGLVVRIVIVAHGDHLSALSNMATFIISSDVLQPLFGDIAAIDMMVISGHIRNEGSYLVTTVFLRNLHEKLMPSPLHDFLLQIYFTQDEHYQKVYFGKYDREEFVDISANGESTSVLVMNTPDKLGLLATVFTVLHGWNITVESAEFHTCCGSAVNKFIISYEGLALTKEAAQDLTRDLWYRVSIGE